MTARAVAPPRRKAVGDVAPRRELRCSAVSDGIAHWERTLVARVVAGDDSALATIYDQYAALVYGIGVRLVGRDHAADVTQEVFAGLWDHPERFDATKGSLRTYLAMVCRRRCIDHLRRGGRREANERRGHDAPLSVVPNVDEAAMAMIDGERLRDALFVLPSHQREAIELAYFGGYTYREVAARLGAPEGTIKSRIRVGLRRLRSELHLVGMGELS